ncbi:Uncharacterised protein [Candidatus Gugararchaeum adminiculabundum]|nr:Uncharacterised protein [Candidatus Gugararchaeum adminiculabundum]
MKKLFALFAAFLLVSTLIFADNTVDIQVSSSSCNGSGGLIESIQNIPACIVEKFFNFIFDGLTFAVQAFLNATFSLILAVPDVHWFCSPYNAIMGIIESLYTLIIMGLGLFYVVRSTDVEGRITAKKWLKNIFLMVITLAFSFYIFEAIIQVNQSITSSLLNQASTNFFSVKSSLSNLLFAIVILLLFTLVAVVTFFTLLFRYILLPFLLFLFPFAIFFYFLPIAENFGKFLLKLILLIVFMSSLDALLILGFFSLFNAADPTLADEFIHAMAGVAAFGAIGVANVIIYVIAILMVLQQGFKLRGEFLSQLTRLAILASML